jgi:hypothetical protein
LEGLRRELRGQRPPLAYRQSHVYPSRHLDQVYGAAKAFRIDPIRPDGDGFYVTDKIGSQSRA